MELVGDDMVGSEAGEDFEVYPQAHGAAPDGPVRAGTGNKGLKDKELLRLGPLYGIYRVVEFYLCLIHTDPLLIPGAAGEEDHLLAPEGGVDRHLHFSIRKAFNLQGLNPVSHGSFAEGIYKVGQALSHPGGIVPHGSGRQYNNVIHHDFPPLLYQFITDNTKINQ
jgi:hypothetical protein